MSSWVFLALTVLIVKAFCHRPISDHNPTAIYDELKALGASCYPLHSCRRDKPNDGLNLCDCDNACSVHDTCCVDSEFRTDQDSPKRKSNLKCLSIYNKPGFQVFMVDSCKSDETFDDLCFSNPEESNDPFLLVPVTSNVTGITYKNYFCAVCNEDVDSTQLEFWDMQIWTNGTLIEDVSMPQLKFNLTMGFWTAFDSESNETSIGFPVTLNIQQNSQVAVRRCSSDLVESCSSLWTNEAVAKKCRGYMAVVKSASNLVKYRNLHCARCNFENVSDLRCLGFESDGVRNISSESDRHDDDSRPDRRILFESDRHDDDHDRRISSDSDGRDEDPYRDVDFYEDRDRRISSESNGRDEHRPRDDRYGSRSDRLDGIPYREDSDRRISFESYGRGEHRPSDDRYEDRYSNRDDRYGSRSDRRDEDPYREDRERRISSESDGHDEHRPREISQTDCRFDRRDEVPYREDRDRHISFESYGRDEHRPRDDRYEDSYSNRDDRYDSRSDRRDEDPYREDRDRHISFESYGSDEHRPRDDRYDSRSDRRDEDHYHEDRDRRISSESDGSDEDHYHEDRDRRISSESNGSDEHHPRDDRYDSHLGRRDDDQEYIRPIRPYDRYPSRFDRRRPSGSDRRRPVKGDARSNSRPVRPYNDPHPMFEEQPLVSINTPLIGLFMLKDRKKRCGRNMVYDKFADKCRCNSRIYVKENRKCVHKI